MLAGLVNMPVSRERVSDLNDGIPTKGLHYSFLGLNTRQTFWMYVGKIMQCVCHNAEGVDFDLAFRWFLPLAPIYWVRHENSQWLKQECSKITQHRCKY